MNKKFFCHMAAFILLMMIAVRAEAVRTVGPGFGHSTLFNDGVDSSYPFRVSSKHLFRNDLTHSKEEIKFLSKEFLVRCHHIKFMRRN